MQSSEKIFCVLKASVVAGLIIALSTPIPTYAAPQKKHVSLRRTSAILAPQLPHIIPDTGILNAADIVAIAKLASKGVSDQFSDDPTLKYVGREFTIILDYKNISSSYDKEKHILEVSTDDIFDGWELDRTSNDGQYKGQNAFGVQVTVSRVTGDIYGIKIPLLDTFQKQKFVYYASLDGETARSMSESVTNFITAKVTGKIKISTDTSCIKNSVICKSFTLSDPTIATPLDVSITRWDIAADIEKVEWIVDRRAKRTPLAG